MQDITCEDKPKENEIEYLNSEELEDPTKVLEIMDHKPTLTDERSVLWAPVAEVPGSLVEEA